MVGGQFWHIQAHNDLIPDLGVIYDTYLNLFTMKIHYNGEFSTPQWIPEMSLNDGLVPQMPDADWYAAQDPVPVDHAHDVDEEVVEGEENVVEEEEEGFVEELIRRMEFGPDVIDMDELNSGDEGDDQAPQHRKRIFRIKRCDVSTTEITLVI
ncbi:hypothetical protein Tco_0907446 [Tanacetum coccineum]|uniref:Uncharacterized protein n=1 Tax=Tanacetum coccineum TaxID=301880 RepID=A0ABQ5CJA6_9ASTR